MPRKWFFVSSILMLLLQYATSQVNYTANDVVKPYDGVFRPGSNMGYFPPWTDEDLANIAAGNPELGINGVGVKAIRPGLFGSFVDEWGYELRLSTYEHFAKLGLKDNTLIVGFPAEKHRDPNFYCPQAQSAMFANLYEPIWDNGEHGTPINENNHYALYIYKLVSLYGKYIKFWEIWNEPGFDFTGAKGWLPPGFPGNWWENNPDPCDYILRAPIFHYIRTLRISYEVIKSLDNDAYVCLSGTGYPSFLDAILRNTDNPDGGKVSPQYPLKGGAYFDVMGFHSYPHFDGATRAWSNAIGGFEYYRHSDAAAAGIPRTQAIYQDVLSKYGYNGNTYPKKQWIITECNVPRKSFSEFLGGEEMQISFIMKAYLQSVRNNFLQLHIYALSEQKGEGEANSEFDLMGLYKKIRDIAPYQQIMNNSGVAYKTTSDQLFGKTYDRARTAAMNLPANIDGGAFRDAQGFYTYMLWAKTTQDKSEQANATYSFPPSFRIFELMLHEWDYARTNKSLPIEPNNIQLTARPIFLQESIFSYKGPDCSPTNIGFVAAPIAGAAIWEWTFQGGQPATSNQRQVTISYQRSGTFTVSLTIRDASGNIIASQSDYLNVKNPPIVDFEAQTNGQILSLTNLTSSNAKNFYWDFGDGKSSTEKIPSHTYANSGRYTITLTATNDCGSVQKSLTVEIKLPSKNRLGFTANDVVPPYDGLFRPGSNLGFFPPWSDEQLATIAAGDLTQQVSGAGVKAIRPALSGAFLEEWGYDYRLNTFKHYENLGLKENTLIVGFPSQDKRDPNHYCPTAQSELFANLYADIWDDGENGTPINDDNYFAAYLYELVTKYGKHIKFWEIWNEPGFDYTGGRGWLGPEQPGNWWTSDPDPCHYKLRAPIQHFIRVLRVSYEVIKTLDPDAYVALSGTGYLSFLDAVLRNTDNPMGGAVTAEYPLKGGAYFDVIGFHSYPHFDGSTKYWDLQLNRFAYKRHSDAAADGIMRVRNQMQGVLGKYGYNGQTYPEKHWIITECNIPRKNFSDFIAGDDVQRNFTIKAYITAARNKFVQLHMYTLAEQEFEKDASYEFHLMGLYKRVRQTAPFTESKNQSGIAYKTTSDLLFGTQYDAERTAYLRLPNGVRGAAFKDVKGKYIYALWAETVIDNSEQANAIYSFPSDYRLTELIKYDWDYSETKLEQKINPNNIILTGAPIFLAESSSIVNAPVAGIKVANQIGCTPYEVQYESISTDAEQYEWHFPGGTPSTSNEPNPKVTYPTVGKYPVTLKVSNEIDAHEYTIEQFIDVREPPKAEFHVEVEGTKATFVIDSEITDFINFFWDFGTGSTFPSNNPTYDFRSNGTYEVAMVPFSYCFGDTIRQTINIFASPVAIIGTHEDTNCSRKIVSFFNRSGNTDGDTEWFFQGGTPSYSKNKDELVIYDKSGTYDVMLVVKNEYGYDTTYQTIHVQVSPLMRINRTLCVGESIEVNGRIYDNTRVYGEERIARGAGLCDSIVIVDLKFLNDEIITNLTPTLCAGETLTINGRVYNEQRTSGIERFTRPNGCDSLVVIKLNYVSTTPTRIAKTLCAGQNYIFGDKVLNQSGLYRDTLFSYLGCDSIVFLTLTVADPIKIDLMEMQDDDGTGSGKAVIQVTGGVPPYTILWNNGIRGNMLENVRFGNYNVSVEDRLKCVTNLDITVNSSNAVPSYFAYPNPVEGGRHINIEFRSPIRQMVRVIINDMQGRNWAFQQFQAEAGTTISSILSPLVSGVYAVQIFYVTTGERYTYMQLVKSSFFIDNGN